MKATLQAWAKNPKTSASGLASILWGIGMIARNYEILFDPVHVTAPLMAIVTGLGLLSSCDATKEADPPKPQDPPWK